VWRDSDGLAEHSRGRSDIQLDQGHTLQDRVRNPMALQEITATLFFNIVSARFLRCALQLVVTVKLDRTHSSVKQIFMVALNNDVD
jgi:hypothetical protein